MNDIEFSTNLHNLLSDSGYKCETTASDADGYSHLIYFKNEAQYGDIHTDKGKIVWIDASEVGVEPVVMPNEVIAGESLEDELDSEYRMMISHLMLGYECDMEKSDFDLMIDNCGKIAKKFANKIIASQREA